MESSSSEFDATKGGSEHLPYSANSLKFAASRSIEIAAMTESILHPSKVKLIFQSLPVHMRRRVMSHNAKRLPRKLRDGHLDQLKKSGLPPAQKRPSRKYRRRPGNLLEEYNRRQRNKIWLETHIWHAKRFHMIERWGHKIAYAPCDKAFRACYRASSAHCLIQDISYYTPIRITGPENLIKDMFSFLSDCSCGLGVCAKAFIGGNREGSIHLYESNRFPFGYIGKVQFIWQTDNIDKNLWLFVHPSNIKQVEIILTDLLTNELKPDNCEPTSKKRKVCTKYSEHVKIKLYPGSFNRFRLTGPKSHAVLAKCLKCVGNLKEIKENKWISTLDHNSLHLTEKYNYWEDIRSVTSPSQLPPRAVVSLIVQDPRLSRPKHRTKALTEDIYSTNTNTILTVPSFISQSHIWDTSLHDIIKKEILNNCQYIKHVTKTQLVPGEVNQNDPILQSIPIVLVQRPGSQDANVKKIGYGSGWDIIIPAGYGMQFWQTFQMFGARSGGLRESEILAFESGECYLPPDSKAGREEEIRIATESKEKYFRLPPSKRVNYLKLGIVTPFACPWKILLKDWSSQCNEEFFVIRNRQVLASLQDCIDLKTELPKIDNTSSCLVPIYVKMVRKGNLRQNALICLPEKDDIQVEKKLFEPHHQDPNEKLRKKKRMDHKIVLKKMKKKRRKLKKSGSVVNSTPKEKSGLSEYTQSMRELWVPSDIDTVRHSCSRQILGFLSKASFSFSESRSCGVGYVAYNALDMLLKQKQNQVLVRNTSSRKYRFAKICVIKVH